MSQVKNTCAATKIKSKYCVSVQPQYFVSLPPCNSHNILRLCRATIFCGSTTMHNHVYESWEMGDHGENGREYHGVGMGDTKG